MACSAVMRILFHLHTDSFENKTLDSILFMVLCEKNVTSFSLYRIFKYNIVAKDSLENIFQI